MAGKPVYTTSIYICTSMQKMKTADGCKQCSFQNIQTIKQSFNEEGHAFKPFVWPPRMHTVCFVEIN